MASRDDSIHSGRHDDEVKVLSTQISFLEEEVAALRGRLADSPRQTHLLEQRLREAEANVAAMTGQNERLAGTLREARDQIIALKEEVDRLAQPPSGYGVFLQATEDGTVDVFTGGRKMRVSVSPGVDLEGLRPGQEVVLNEALNIVIAQGYETIGEVVMLKELLDGGDRALVIAHADEERIARLAEPLIAATLRPGDSLLLEPRSGYVYERIPKAEVEELILEEVPDIAYSEIGGLGPQIEQIRDAIELPYLHADLFREHQLRPPKGVLLYGPPGCGKTLIAKAVANSLAKQVAARTAQDAESGARTCRARSGARSSSTSRAPSCSTSTWARPSGTSGWCSSGRGRRPARACRSSCSSTRWTRSSAPAGPACPATWRTRSCRSC